ncbi:MAG: hypothetical protein ACE3L7_32955 [Candidatus Pristimantibacillus sp.]
MNEKFERVIDEFSKHECYVGDDELIHAVLAECEISNSELSDLMKYLTEEYNRSGNDKVEQLQYGINFIFEAQERGYTVGYPSIYINTTASETNY